MKRIPIYILDLVCDAEASTELECYLISALIEAYNEIDDLKEKINDAERQVSAVYTEKTETEDSLEELRQRLDEAFKDDEKKDIKETIEHVLTMPKEEFDRISNE